MGVATSAGATHTWNTDHRLTQVQIAQGQSVNKTVRYGYDTQGRRVKKRVTEGANTTETHYVLDTERTFHEIVIERTRINSGPWQERSYLHTPGGVGELLSESDGSTSGTSSTRQIYSDGQGSIRLAIDGSETLSWSFDAFGNLQAGSSAPITHGYTGERYDPDTGLIHLRARDYDPQTGRFISMDEHPGSQRIPLTLNKYLYANADPVNHVDPSGYLTLGGMMSGAINISLAYARFMLVDFITDRLVSPIIDAVMTRYAGEGRMPGGNITVNVIINSPALQCAIIKKKCIIKKIPIISHGKNIIGHARHIFYSQFGHGNTISGAGVTSSILVRGRGRTGGAWYNKFHPCNKGYVGDGLSCDEYPFASTLNGSKDNYMMDTVSLMLLPGNESTRQMIFLDRFYKRGGVKFGMPFISVGNPLRGSYFIDRNGNKHDFK